MRILVTNDDGIDSVGLHVLARAMNPLAEVVVAAPDSEYSGASAAFGALHLIRPEMHKAHIEGIETAWSITGPPALCVMFARMGAFGEEPFDLIVSGINPGANVGRAVYHSGTIGACITGRSGGVSGVAVSQSVNMGDVMGQGWDEMLRGQLWESAGEVAAVVVRSLLDNLPAEAGVLNLNVPNLAVSDIKGWRRTAIGARPMRSMATVDIEPKLGHEEAYYLKFKWGEMENHEGTEDVGAVSEGYVATTWLSTIHPVDHPGGDVVDAALDTMFDR